MSNNDQLLIESLKVQAKNLNLAFSMVCAKGDSLYLDEQSTNYPTFLQCTEALSIAYGFNTFKGLKVSGVTFANLNFTKLKLELGKYLVKVNPVNEKVFANYELTKKKDALDNLIQKVIYIVDMFGLEHVTQFFKRPKTEYTPLFYWNLLDLHRNRFDLKDYNNYIFELTVNLLVENFNLVKFSNSSREMSLIVPIEIFFRPEISFKLVDNVEFVEPYLRILNSINPSIMNAELTRVEGRIFLKLVHPPELKNCLENMNDYRNFKDGFIAKYHDLLKKRNDILGRFEKFDKLDNECKFRYYLIRQCIFNLLRHHLGLPDGAIHNYEVSEYEGISLRSFLDRIQTSPNLLQDSLKLFVDKYESIGKVYIEEISAIRQNIQIKIDTHASEEEIERLLNLYGHKCEAMIYKYLGIW